MTHACFHFIGPWEFTTSGRSGRYGVIQTFTVPRTTLYQIKAWGARGGTHSYSYGYRPGTYYGGTVGEHSQKESSD